MEAFDALLGRMLLQVLADGHAPEPLFPAQPVIEVKEEIPSIVLIVLPCVLAVQNDRDQAGTSPRPLPDAVEPVQEVMDGVPVIPFRIYKADEIGQGMVP